jgi:ASC-1-like (ASCH) protein
MLLHMLHVAVLHKKYLDLILAGEKTVECRLTVQNRAPYQAVEPGQRIYLKQSAGPYRAMAVAEHVLFESNLSPKRLREIQRDYNHLICGDAEHWQAKANSKYLSLIWLNQLQAIDTGPLIRPMQGAAWMVLDEEPAWRRNQPAIGDAGSFAIEITEGNLRNNSLYVTKVWQRFPPWAIGGTSQASAARPLTLMLHDGPTVQTDIVGPRKLLRTRVWGKWFAKHGAQAGDRVVFTPHGETGTYLVGLARS